MELRKNGKQAKDMLELLHDLLNHATTNEERIIIAGNIAKIVSQLPSAKKPVDK